METTTSILGTPLGGLIQRAELKFEAGKKFYQANDIPNARRAFDAATDMMLDAADRDSAGRQEYERRLEEMIDAINHFDLVGMGASAGVEEGRFEKTPLEDILQMTFPVDPRLKDKVREQVAATTSQLPLSVNDAVLGYINYFANRGHRTLVAGFQRSGMYRSMIQRVLDEEGVPPELIHLAQAESGFIPRAVSNKAAGGMWQFVVFRGQEYGLMQTRYTDDRMDPEMATRAAARHLHDLYNEFGDWYLAIAAYNCGPGTVEKAVERTGFADFWELRARGVLPIETTNYVPIILAMTIMEKNAAEYGLNDVQMESALQYDTVQIPSLTNLSLVSDMIDTPLPELSGLNPAVLKGMVPENYSLHVPKGKGEQVAATLQMIPAAYRASYRMHRVSANESLADIGKRYGVAANTLIAANNLKSSDVVEGDRLLIPAAARTEAPAAHRALPASTRASNAHPSLVHRTSAPVRQKAKTKTAATKTASNTSPAGKAGVILASAARE